MPSNKTILKVENVYKTFKVPHENVNTVKSLFLNPFREIKHTQFVALEDVSFDLKQGEFLGVIGRNGSGKSTLLKLIAGIYEPDKGKITVDGKIVPFLELGVGFNPELTAKENVYLNGTILGMSKKFLNNKYEEIMDFADVKEFEDMPLKNFSSGMYVRLAFSIAIQTEADVYLLDEVLAVGDQIFQAKSLKRLMQLKRMHKTIIFVSHALNDIETHCSRVIYIKDHKVAADGKPADVVNMYKTDNFEASQEENQVKADNTEKSKKDTNDKKMNDFIDITSVRLFSKDNKSKTTFLTGEEFTIQIIYQAKKRIRHPKIGIAIYKDMDKIIYGTNNEKRDLKINEIKENEKGAFNFNFRSLTLLEGNYQISVAIGDEGNGLLTQYDREFEFTVDNGKLRDYGAVNLAPDVEQKIL